MTTAAGKEPKKKKDRKQTPEERLAALHYNHMMYGPTPNELRPAGKRTDYGASYLHHPKFQSLMTAFKQGTKFEFNVSDKGKTYAIATQEAHILFDGKIIYYSRPLNRYENNLLMDRAAVVQYQGKEALVHLVFAVLHSFPELEAPPLSYLHNQFYLGAETLDTGIAQQGSNLLMGSFRNLKALEKPKR